MKSDFDALTGKLYLNITNTGVLGEATLPFIVYSSIAESYIATQQYKGTICTPSIWSSGSKTQSFSNIAALVQFLTST